MTTGNRIGARPATIARRAGWLGLATLAAMLSASAARAQVTDLRCVGLQASARVGATTVRIVNAGPQEIEVMGLGQQATRIAPGDTFDTGQMPLGTGYRWYPTATADGSVPVHRVGTLDRQGGQCLVLDASLPAEDPAWPDARCATTPRNPVGGRTNLTVVNDGERALYLQKLAPGSLGVAPGESRTIRDVEIGQSYTWVANVAADRVPLRFRRTVEGSNAACVVLDSGASLGQLPADPRCADVPGSLAGENLTNVRLVNAGAVPLNLTNIAPQTLTLAPGESRVVEGLTIGQSLLWNDGTTRNISNLEGGNAQCLLLGEGGQGMAAASPAATAPVAPASGGTGPSVLPAGQAIEPGKRYMSPSGAYFMTLNPDGNLVVARSSDDAFIWGLSALPGVDFRRGTSARVTPEGQLVLSDAAGAPVWAVPAAGAAQPGSALAVGDDGVLRLGPEGRPTWASVEFGTLPLQPGDRMEVDKRYRAGDHYLVQNRDGNLVVARARDMQFVWGLSAIPTLPFTEIATITMQPDGHLVAARRDGAVVWQKPDANAVPGATANLTPEGVLYIQGPNAAGPPIWTSAAPPTYAGRPATPAPAPAPTPTAQAPTPPAAAPVAGPLQPAGALPLRANQYLEPQKKYLTEDGTRYVVFPEDGNMALYETDGDKYYGGLVNYLETGEWKTAAKAGLNAEGNFALWDENDKLLFASDIPQPDPGSTLEINGGGDLVIRDSQGRVRWNMRDTRGGNDKYPANRSLSLPAAERVPDAFDTALLDVHNEYRALHGVQPMQWSPALAAEAQSWADTCGPQDHATAEIMKGAGENLAALGSTDALGDPAALAKRAKEGWYDEEKVYDYNNPGFNMRGGSQELQTGHFTQWVWADTNELGCGVAACPNSDFPMWMVCRYYPGGNGGGRDAFVRNVPPPRG
jgi:hypothetical protein